MAGLRYLLIAAIMLVVFGILLWSAYNEVRVQTISEFNKQQLLLAHEAALGISQQIGYIKQTLVSLAQAPQVIEIGPQCEQVMQRQANGYAGQITALTRMDANGIIQYTVPFVESSIGADIGGQPHVKAILGNHETHVSEVFRAVQGYDAIAIHVPVFDDGEFSGSVAALIPFEQLTEKFLKEIKPSESGYAWVISGDGTELYCPVPGHTGQSVYDTSAEFPSIIEMAERMMREETGSSTYTFDRIGDTKIEPVTKHAVFCPIDLGNTHWSIVVATPEHDVLATMKGFRNRLLLILLLYLVASTIYSIAVLRNITALREARLIQQAEHEKAQLTLQYLQAQRLEAVGRLAAGVAHDLNNLMTPVLGYTELMLEDPETKSESQELLQGIKEASLRARDLIQHLLLFARTQEIKGCCLDLNKLVQANEKLLLGTIREDLILTFDLQAEPATILADTGQIEQILMNLVINAQDAMPGGGSLLIATRNAQIKELVQDATPPLSPGMYVVLQISDTGTGIDEEILPMIFDPFFTTKDSGRGTGLGLSSVHGIVSQHTGSIIVESEVGRGTSFSLYFQQEKWTAPEIVEPAIQPPAASRPKSSILVVEDNDLVRAVTTRLLTMEGFEVYEADNGVSALSLLDEINGNLSLLLTDIIMPDLNGKALSQEIKHRYPEIKVLFMSGYSVTDDDQHSPLEPEDHMIQKPFTREDLITEIDRLIAT